MNDVQPLVTCANCRGAATIEVKDHNGNPCRVFCPRCGGAGNVAAPEAYKAETLFPGVPVVDLQPDPNAPAPARKKPEHPFLKAELYEKCHGCKGTGKTTAPMMVDGMRAETKDGDGVTHATRFFGRLAPGSACPLCSGANFVEVGLTVGQVERFRGMNEVTIPALAKIVTAALDLVGEGSLSASAQTGLAELGGIASAALAMCGNEGKAALLQAAREAKETKPRS